MINAIDAKWLVIDAEKNPNNPQVILGETFLFALQVQDNNIEYAARGGKTWCIFRFHNTVFDVWEKEARQEYEKRGFEFRRSNINGNNDDIIICW